MDKVLIIYNVKQLGDLISFICSTAGFEVRIINNPFSIFDCIDDFKPNLIIMDVFLKYVDGLYFLERLKSEKKLSQIPVLIVSSKNDPLALFDSLERGAVDYIPAPINEDVLIEKVKKILQK